MNNLRCTGHESKLTDCPRGLLHSGICSDERRVEAGVRCGELKRQLCVVLVGGGGGGGRQAQSSKRWVIETILTEIQYS